VAPPIRYAGSDPSLILRRTARQAREQAERGHANYPETRPGKSLHTVKVRPLPSGTLTLLFSDIEGSTSMLKRLGAHWGDALSAQRAIVRAAFANQDGHEMGTEGDSFFVVFSSAHQALRAAVEAQRRLHEHDWPGEIAVKVRMGLHTGEPQRHEDGYIGIDVHRAARIAATASGGQIVISDATRALIEGPQTADVGLRDLGWHRLKDLAELEHLHDVIAPGLPDEFPPLRSLGTRANLPTYGAELVGRSAEVAAVVAAIEHDGARLVTLTGPGGTGKTRLAVAVASNIGIPLDIFFVSLHTADRSALMWAAIAEAAGAPADVERLPDERAIRILGDRPTLLILDNVEQIADADHVVSRLLNEAREVRALVTSRRPLHLVDEQEWPVTPLGVPRRGPVDVAAAREAGAVSLFVRRARMVRPGFDLTQDNVADVIAVCRRLDGLPLAIELAAARVRLLSPRALLSRIDNRLGEGVTATDRAERQRTLGATIAWSYELLDEDDQRILRQLGVFSKAADLAAVEFVAGSDGRDALDAVAHLVDVSLVQVVEAADGEPLVSMLETIRWFARDRLRASVEYDDMRLRHAQWCDQRAREIGELLDGPMQMTALDRMGAVEEDIRAALDWCLRSPDEASTERRECGYVLLGRMNTYWYRFGYAVEGRGWYERALNLVDSSDRGDSVTVVDALHGMGILCLQLNDLEVGSGALERALDMARRLSDRNRESREANSLGVARREAGDVAGARALVEHSLALGREIGSPRRVATALTNLAMFLVDAGDYVAAVTRGREAVAADLALDDPWGVAVDHTNLVLALLHAEGPQAAYDHLDRVADEVLAVGDPDLAVDFVESFAAVAAALGQGALCASLVAACDMAREQIGLPRTTPNQQHLARFTGPANVSIGGSAWDQAYADGAGWNIEQAVAEGRVALATHGLLARSLKEA